MPKKVFIYLKFKWNRKSYVSSGNPAPPHFQNLVGFCLLAVQVGCAQSSNMYTWVSKGMQARPFSGVEGAQGGREGDLTDPLHMCLLGVFLLPRSHLKHGLVYFLTN